ncbi:oligosaccharide flippase family protein [Schaalia sp. ZJ405]|uniref:lipopolysaccharide biosynthesis protein n=1 Tax=Schaalia sp. ZJ405 TaxID=2709403 RepID=UPI0013EB1486|nr:oligosaccharide flippase family protein [Schaalia sp. ZJ405]QPK81701.1 oligosaccharide flippase family protein [Schaalia sp. ZJ405]
MFQRMITYGKNVSASSPFLRYVLTLVTGTAAAQVVVFFMTMIITRLYGREMIGEFGTFNAIVAVVVAVAAGRYDMALMLEADDRDAKVLAKLAFRTILVVSFIVTFLSFPLRPLVAHHYSQAVADWLPLAGLTTLFMSGAALVQYWYNRKTDYKTIALNRVQQQIGTSGGQVVFGWAGLHSIAGLISGQILGQAWAFFNLGFRAKDLRHLDTTGSKSMKALARKHWKMPVLNGPNVLVDTVRANGINLLIGRVSVGDFGEYLIANQVVSVPVTLINSAVSQVFFQKLSTIQPGHMLKEVRNLVKRALIIGTIPFALLWLVAPWLLPILFGPDFSQSGYYARALIPWMAMLLITSPISTLFVTTGTQHWLLVFSILYTLGSLSWLIFSPLDLLGTIYVLGLIMAAFLLVMTAMSIFAARRFDRRAANA